MKPRALHMDLLDELELPSEPQFDDDPDPDDDWGEEDGC